MAKVGALIGFIVIYILTEINDGYMTDSLRMVSVNAHNTLRSQVAMGNAPNKNGTKLPQAKNMMEVTWSKMVEGYAQTVANSCKFEHSITNNTGQNLWVTGSTAGYVSPAVAFNSSVYSWYGELKSNGQNSLTITGTNYNHFTQVVWAKTKEIGCAAKNCSTMTGVNFGPGYKYVYVVCDYSPAGNYMNQQIYTPGPGGSACPNGSTAVTATKLCKVNNLAVIH